MNVHRIIRSVVAVVLGAGLALGAAAPALADTRDDLTAADGALGTALTAFTDAMNDQDITADQFVAAATAFVDTAKGSVDGFRSVAANDPDATVRGYAKDFADETQQIIDAVNGLATGVQDGDKIGISTAGAAFQAGLDAYLKTADAVNAYIADNPLASGDPLYALWLVLLIVSLAMLVGAILLAVLARHQDGALPAKTLRDGRVRQLTLRSLRRNLVIFTAIFVVGAAIPFVQYWIIAHNGGDQYVILWYPLAAGAILAVISAVQYVVVLARVRKEGSAPLAVVRERSAAGVALAATMPVAAVALSVQESRAAKAAAADGEQPSTATPATPQEERPAD